MPRAPTLASRRHYYAESLLIQSARENVLKGAHANPLLALSPREGVWVKSRYTHHNRCQPNRVDTAAVGVPCPYQPSKLGKLHPEASGGAAAQAYC